MNTELIYLTDPYKKENTAKIIDITDGLVQFDSTIFYPFGGGQPTDQGIIKIGEIDIQVQEVSLREDKVLHKVSIVEGLSVGDEVEQILNWDRRYKNMKVHSAGHVVDFAVFLAGYSPGKLQPVEGSHSKKPFVKYQVNSEIEIDTLKQEVKSKIDELLSSNKEFSWKFVDLETLQQDAIYLQPGLPENKPLRMLSLEGVGSVADGGTIVKKISEVPHIEINPVVEGDSLTINYSLSEVQESNKSNSTSSVSVELRQDFQNIVEEVKAKVSDYSSEEQLTELWREFLGKKGKLKDLMSEIINITAEERKSYGAEVNTLRSELDSIINSAKEEILNKKQEQYLSKSSAKLTSTKPKIGHLHPLTETINDLNKIMKGIGYSIYDGPELETAEFNFDRCNVPADHPAMDLQDSIYIQEPNLLLRTQTSSIEARALTELEPPYKIVMPGRVYRNEKVNKSNHFIFHQYQLVCVQEKVSMAELISTIDHIFKSYLGEDVVVRYRNKYYPEVEPGLGLDQQCPFCGGKGCAVCKNRGWIEMGGAGIIHPNIIRMAGLDKDKWQGFAFGLGLDRWAMSKHNIKDIRTLLGGNLAYKPHVG